MKSLVNILHKNIGKKLRPKNFAKGSPIQRILDAAKRDKKKYTINLKWGGSKDTAQAEEEAWRTAGMFVADIISGTNHQKSSF